PGLAGWVIQLVEPATDAVVAVTATASRDVNGDGQIDPETEQGWYELAAPPGRYEVREVLQPGWIQTFPEGRTEAVTQGNAASSTPVFSADGRFVAFRSQASNLVSGDNNGVADIFVLDRWTGTIERVSVDSAGRQANGPSYEASLS